MYEPPARAEPTKKNSKITVSECLKQASFLALITNSWTSKATQGYNIVTAYFINGWKLNSLLLQTTAMDVSHTTKSCQNFLLRLLQNGT